MLFRSQNINDVHAPGLLLAYAPQGTHVACGDKVTLDGALSTPQPFLTNTGHLFDYPGYLKARGISVVMPKAKLTQVSSGGVSLCKVLFSVKHAFEQKLEDLMSEPQVALMEGLLLGEKRGLPPMLMQAFVIAGLIHVVVLSGYNISVVSDATLDRKSTRLNSSHIQKSRMPSSA